MRQYHNPNKGAVKLAQNYTEYAYNYSTSATTDTTSFAWGEEGVPFRNFAPSGTDFVEKRVRFKNPIKSDDVLILEINWANTKWVPMANNGVNIGNFISNEAGTAYFGVATISYSTDPRDISICFYSKPYMSPSATWSDQNNNRWRVRKISSGNFAESPQINPSITVDGAYTVQHGIETVNVNASEASILLNSMIPSDRVTIRKLGSDATKYITITPPAGSTIEGRSELKLYGQYSYVELERVSETVFVIKDLNAWRGTGNTTLGTNTLLSNTTGTGNTAVGSDALRTNTVGLANTAVGASTLLSNTDGTGNTAVGTNALRTNTTHNSTAVGSNALLSNTTGYGNTAVGIAALYSNTTGYENTAVGNGAGSTHTGGYNNTFLGSGASGTSPTASNQITLGNGSITSLRCAVTTISSLSDRRDKKNIEKLEIGLDFVKALNPCGWNYDLRENYPDGKADGSKMKKERNHGFIAQDLQKIQKDFGVDLGLVLEDNPDKLETSEGRLLPVMVKAIQELSERLEKLEGVK